MVVLPTVRTVRTALRRVLSQPLVVAVALAVVVAVLAARPRWGEWYTPPKQCQGLFCTRGAQNGGGVYSSGTPARFQYLDGDDGYCGECSIQVIMTKYGVWVPQAHVRKAGRDVDVLVETNSYPTAFKTMKIRAEQFRGNGYQAYIGWIKERLVKGFGCIMVYNFKESTPYPTYDHIVSVTGIKTQSPNGGYDANDTLMVHTHFTAKPVDKRAGSFQCKGNRGSWPTLEGGGCVPNKGLRGWAWAILGPEYQGIGPHVELVMDSNKEGGVRKPTRTTMKATVVLHGLTPGTTYAVYQYTDPKQVPSSPNAKLSGAPWKTVTATGDQAELPVSFPSDQLRYFIAVEGAGGGAAPEPTDGAPEQAAPAAQGRTRKPQRPRPRR